MPRARHTAFKTKTINQHSATKYNAVMDINPNIRQIQTIVDISVTVALTIVYHCGDSEVSIGAQEESASPAWLAASATDAQKSFVICNYQVCIHIMFSREDTVVLWVSRMTPDLNALSSNPTVCKKIVKLLACGTRGAGCDTRSRHLNF